MKIFASLLAVVSLVSIASGAPPAPAPAAHATAPAAAPVKAPPPPLDATLEAVGAIGKSIYNRADMHPEALAKNPVILHLTIKSTNTAATNATVSLTAEDMFSKPVAINGESQFSVPLQKGEGQKDIPFKAPGPGYFLIHADVHAGADEATATADFGIVPPPIPGVRPYSQFSTTGGEAKDDKLDFFQAIGLKLNRCNFSASHGDLKGLAPGQAPSLDFTTLDEKFDRYKSRGLWIFPVSNYTLGSGDELTPMAAATGMYGPPADELRYAKVYALTFQHYPEMKVAEFYNEPWIYGYGFAGTPADYDRFQKTFCQEVLKLRPDFRIIAGNSNAFVMDNIEPYPSCWKGLLSGISDHPYTKDDSDSSWRCGANSREFDAIRMTAQRMGLPYAYLTEATTAYPKDGSPAYLASPAYPKLHALQQQEMVIKNEIKTLQKALPPGTKPTPQIIALNKQHNSLLDESRPLGAVMHDDIHNAAKNVQMGARASIEGLFQGCGAGSPGNTRVVTAYAVMTHMIEDRPAVADIWPANELIWGGIFANPKFVTPEVKALPRAKEISVRWGVAIPKERQDDKTKVAIIWSLTGQSNMKLDNDGTLTIAKSDGLQAYDMTGRVIPSGPDGLTVPFCNNPVYITSDTLSVVELRDRIANGIIKNVTPVNMYALSLMDDPTQPQKLSVRVENQLNVPVKGTLHLKVAGASEETSTPFTIEAAKLAEVAVPWPKGVTPNEDNHYNITISAEVSPAVDAKMPSLPVTVSRQQIASVAKFVKKTIAINGSVDDWKGVTPVVLDSSLLHQEIDESFYTLHPNIPMPTEDPNAKKTVVRVYTAYDKDYVYLAAAFNEDTFTGKAGEPLSKGRGSIKQLGSRYKSTPLPGKSGMPDGMGFPSSGDCFQFSFGFRDRVPGLGRQMDDLYAWKGNFYDTDYQYYANPSTEGDMLTRVWGADTSRGEGYQLAKVPGQGVVAQATPTISESNPPTATTPGQGSVAHATSPLDPLPNGKIKITRNEDTKLTLYEMAIPRSELKLFDPEKGRCRFGFLVYPSDRAKGAPPLNWCDAAGVFDYWQNFGSFLPTFGSHTACQTFFGIEK